MPFKDLKLKYNIMPEDIKEYSGTLTFCTESGVSLTPKNDILDSLIYANEIYNSNYANQKMSYMIVMPEITKVVFNDPATIVFWDDGSKTVVKCQDGDTYSKETGLVFAIAKKALGNKGNFNETLKKWCKQ